MDNEVEALYVPLERLDGNLPHEFIVPVKKIESGHDVSTFLVSRAYRDIVHFLLQLNRAMFPLFTLENGSDQKCVQSFEIGSPTVQFSDTVIQLRKLLFTLNSIVDEVPLDTGPRRFGNLSFRKWYELVESRATEILNEYLPPQVCSFKHGSDMDALTELRGYLLGSFGSPQRLDYGTGHELSFLAFLACVWKLDGFLNTTYGREERGIVLGVIEPYLGLVRRLILTYTLEPAGSHGVWGLDDHSFIPYIFGSAQYGPPITDADQVPTEGSLSGAPDPGIVTKAKMVERHRKTNMYFSAIGFIYDVKKGPFWEHSPTLYDISGIQAGWGKINKGMVKMYNAEVLSKFPVVQHFPFGSLFSWDRDPQAVESPSSIHTSSQPIRNDTGTVSIGSASMRHPLPNSTGSPWTAQRTSLPDMVGGTQTPWVKSRPSGTTISRVAGSGSTISYGVGGSGSRSNAPMSVQDTQSMHTLRNRADDSDSGMASLPPPTKAPWAK